MKLVKLFAISSILLLGTLCGSTLHASADSLTNSAVLSTGVTVAAQCFDSTNNIAYWSATNPTVQNITLNWATDDADASGSYAAPSGITQFSTSYDENEPTESFIFSQANQADITLLVATDECAQTTPPTCVDGTNRDNLNLDWSPTGSVTITTKNNAPLCDDITVYLSTYTLPDTYDKTGIFDDSSIPQQLFDSTSSILKKGTSGGVTLTAKVPDACTNYQMDAYYPPEIVKVTGAGHGSQLIYGKIYVATATDCTSTPPVIPPTTPPTTPPGHVLGASTTAPVAMLTNTGFNTALSSTLATLFIITALLVKFPIVQTLKERLAQAA